MIRRVHVGRLVVGSIALDSAEAHHLRDVLRLDVGTTVELFDDSGQTASAVIRTVNIANVVVQVETILPARQTNQLIVAAAVPKGDRADWMIEKLTELGVARFIPLAAERSVVLPSGKNKIERWERAVIESAKQSRRPGLLVIDPLMPVSKAVEQTRHGWYLSTAPGSVPIKKALPGLSTDLDLTLFIGPEGGWSPVEIQRFDTAGFTPIGLTSTILRVETAAITAAAVILCQ